MFLLGFGFFYRLEALGAPWASLSYALRFVAKLLCFCLCLFDIIVELYAMDEKYFVLGKWKWNSCVIKAYLIQDMCFVYVAEAITTLN